MFDGPIKKLETILDKTSKEVNEGKYWEYIVDTIGRPEALQPLLTSRGKDRWELVSVVNDTLFFKRPMQKGAKNS